MRKVLFVLSLVVACSVFADQVESMFVRDAVGLKSMAAAPRLADREGAQPMVTLAPATQVVPEEIAAIREWNDQRRTPAKIGFTRSIGDVIAVRMAPRDGVAAASAGGGVVTESERGTVIWSGSVRVEGAHRLRLHLQNVNVPMGTIFWSYGRGQTPRAFGTELIDENGELYAPTAAGDIAYLEVEIPAGASNASFVVRDVLEMLPVEDSVTHARMPQTDDTPSCLIDGMCPNSGNLDVIAQYRKAVAHLQYVKNGSGFVCSGGLVNDSDTSSVIPYLLTANHCFSSQASATTLESYFDYTTASCGAALPNINTFVPVNGATLLATSATTDFTLVRLNSIPSGRVLLGWTTTPPAQGTLIHRLSHPFPDSYSQPAPQAYSTTTVNTTVGTCSGSARPNYIYSSAVDGGVYGGSSGSPVIVAGGQIVGQLKGSCGPVDPTAGCDDSNSTVDGAFAQTYASVATFLNPGTTNNCTASSTTACMLNGRFRVTLRFRNGFDNGAVDSNANVKSVSGFANPAFETGFFYFNNENNIEMLIKILDQGNTNSQGQPTIAVLFGSATPLRIELTIFDTLKGATKVYTSNFNAMAGATDFTAFVK